MRARAPDDELAEEQADAEGSDRQPAKPKRKKKKRKKRPAETTGRAPQKLAGGAERPAFLRSFPADPELDRLVAAFEAGDYATVRERAPELAERAEDPRVRDAALELARRIEPDPLIRYMLFASIGLLLFLVLYFYSHKH